MSSLGRVLGCEVPRFLPRLFNFLGATSALRQGVAIELGAVGAVFGH